MRVLQQRREAVGEAHRAAQVARPVAGIGRLLGGDPRAGDVRDERDLRRVATRDPRHLGGERRERPAPSSPSGRRARCAAGVTCTPCSASSLGERVDRGSGPETTQSAGALTAASARSLVEQRQHLRLGQRHGEHRARAAVAASAARARRPARARRRTASTPARQAATYSPTLWPIIARGRIAPGHPQLRQRVLDDEERRLGERGLRAAAASGASASAPLGIEQRRAGRGRARGASSSAQRSIARAEDAARRS